MAPYHHQHFQKPENALRRAEELLTVGQQSAALHALHDVITSRRHRTWSKTLEKIMMKYVELCVDTRRTKYAKDGLIQYRQVCQQVNVGSLEDVIKEYLRLATERAEKAKQSAADLKGVTDLDEINTPEELMLSYVTAEKDSDRHDRENVMPWFKFLWETYRNCLDILKNNAKLEAVYSMTALRAFQFCKEYQRTTEFRRVCETIRNHLVNLQKYKERGDRKDSRIERPDLAKGETLQLYLDTRFEQLKVATELELWQEAFRSVEDIHSLMCIVKKTPKPQSLAIYYTRLTSIFFVAEAYLYHASAWYRLYNMMRRNQNLSPADFRIMSSAVLISTLAASPFEKDMTLLSAHEQEIENDRQIRIAALLGFHTDPRKDVNREGMTRQSLMTELVAKGFPSVVCSELRELYQVLETEFRPHDMCTKVQQLLDLLTANGHELSNPLSAHAPFETIEIEKYIAPLQRVASLRQLQQISTVYSTVKITFLRSLFPHVTVTELDMLLVHACSVGVIHAKVDYQKNSVSFETIAMESERMKNQLATVATRLSTATSLIKSAEEEKKEKKNKMEGNTIRASVFSRLAEESEEEHKRCLARKVIIERRKEESEQKAMEKQKEEEERKAKQQQLSLEAERKRLLMEEARRERERLTRELEEQDMEEARKMLEESQSKKKGKKVTIEAGAKLDKRQIMEEALQEQIKERQESERKLIRMGRQMDHYERAKREEELPLLSKMIVEAADVAAANFQRKQEEEAKKAKEMWEQDVILNKEVAQFKSDYDSFASFLSARKRDEVAAFKLAEAERLAEQKSLRMAERDLARKKEYLRRLRERRREEEEEERRRREEEEEERRRRAEEEREQRRKEEEARRDNVYVPRYRTGGTGDSDRYGGRDESGDSYPPRSSRGYDDRRGSGYDRDSRSGGGGFSDRYGGPRKSGGGGFSDSYGRRDERRGGGGGYGGGGYEERDSRDSRDDRDSNRPPPPPPRSGGYVPPNRR